MTDSTAWPDGYRFLAICGAYVDIRKQGRDHTGSCSGCPEGIDPTNLRDAAKWGQKHAAVCRGLPRPEGDNS